MDGNGIQLRTVGDAILRADWQMACSPWLWLASARVISVKAPPTSQNFAKSDWLARPLVFVQRLGALVIGCSSTSRRSFCSCWLCHSSRKHTCLPALKLWIWKSVLSWVWKWSVSGPFVHYGELLAESMDWSDTLIKQDILTRFNVFLIACNSGISYFCPILDPNHIKYKYKFGLKKMIPIFWERIKTNINFIFLFGSDTGI